MTPEETAGPFEVRFGPDGQAATIEQRIALDLCSAMESRAAEFLAAVLIRQWMEGAPNASSRGSIRY